MGRLYEQIRKDIEKLRQIDEAIKNKQLISMDEVFNVSVSLQKIDYVITYAEQIGKIPLAEVGRFPYGDMENFNLPEDFEASVNDWENSLSEEQIDHAINHLQLQDQAEPYVPEITPHNANGYYNYIDETLHHIVAVSQTDHFGISRDGVALMAVSAQQELVKNVFSQDYAFNPNDKRGQEILDFIDDPIGETITRNQGYLSLNGTNEVREFLQGYKDFYADVVNRSDHPRPFDEAMSYYPVAKALAPIHKSKWNAHDLSDALEDSVRNYIRDYQGKKGQMNIGSFVSLAKDRIESTLLDHAIQLGEDPDSKFLKDFMANPVSALEQRFRDHSNNPHDINSNRNARCADTIHNEQANYNQASAGKVSRFAQFEQSKKTRFEAFFNEHNINFNPATFKHRFQGNAFERFLGRTSKEWNDLAECVDSWKNTGTERNYDKAADLAEKYLRHKFPNVDPKDVTEEMCQGLRGAGRDRGLFCMTLVQGKAAAEDSVNREIYEAANRRFDEYEARLHRGVHFQDQLAGDLEENSKNEHAHHDDEIVNDNLIVKDSDMSI